MIRAVLIILRQSLTAVAEIYCSYLTLIIFSQV